MYSKILSTGSYLPKHIRTNADLEKMVDTSDEWISERTGIKERRIAEASETVATMGFEAAQNCLAVSPMDVNEIDLIVVARLVQHMLFQVRHVKFKKCSA